MDEEAGNIISVTNKWYQERKRDVIFLTFALIISGVIENTANKHFSALN